MPKPYLVLLVLLLGCISGTEISYFREEEVESQKDYMELTVTVTAEDSSLTEALENGREYTVLVKQVSEAFCKANAKNKKECLEVF